MKKIVTQILFVFLMLVASSTVSSAQGILTTNNLTPSPVCQGSALQLEFVSTIDMSSITTLKVKFYKGTLLLDSVNVATTFDVSPFKQDVQFVTIPATVFGSGIVAKTYFIGDSSLNWISAATATFTVNPTPTVNSVATKSICSNSSVSYTITSATLNASYIWTASELTAPTGGSITGFSDCAAACGNIINQTLVNSGTSSGVVRYVITPTGPSPSFCPGTPFNFDVTVQPVAVVQATPTSATICGGTGPGINLSSSTTGSVNYVWTASLISGTATGFSSSNGSTINQTLTNSTNSPATVRYVVTPRIGTANCPGTPINVDVIVNPKGNVTQPLNQVVCNSALTSVSFSTANTGGITTFAWTNSNPSIGLAANGNGDILFTASNTGTAPISGTIVVTPTFTNGATSCVGSSKTFTIIVNPDAQVIQPANQVVCNNSSINVSFISLNSGGTTTYNWTNNTPSIGLAGSGNGNISAFNAVNNGTSPVVATIIVTPTFTNAGNSCNGPSKTFTITVNPTGQVIQPANQVLCNNSNTLAISFGSDNTGGTTTYNWTNDKPSIGLSSNGFGDILSFNATNNSAIPVVATIIVTPTFTNGGTSCNGPSKTFTITVNATPSISISSSSPICSKVNLPINITSSTSGNNSLSWTTDQPAYVVTGSSDNSPQFSSSTNFIVNQIYDVNSVNFSNIVYTFVDTSVFGCVSAPTTYTVSIKPKPRIDAIFPNDTICSGTQVLLDVSTDIVDLVTWSVTSSLNATNLNASSIFKKFNETPTNNNDSIGYYTLFVSPKSALGCLGNDTSLTIYVNPNPSYASVGLVTDTICDGGASQVRIIRGNSAIDNLNWQILGGSINQIPILNDTTLINFGNLSNPSSIGNGLASVIVDTFIITPITSLLNSCSGKEDTLRQKIYPTPKILTVTAPTICSSTSTNISMGTNLTPFLQSLITYTFTPTSNAALYSGEGPQQNNVANFSNQVIDNLINTNNVAVPYTVNIKMNSTCTGPNFLFNQKVRPVAKITNLAISDSICEGKSKSILLNGSIIGEGLEYKINRSFNSSFLSSNANYINSTNYYLQLDSIGWDKVLNSNSSQPFVASYFVEIRDSTNLHCQGSNFNFSRTINPTPRIMTSLSDSLCSGLTYSGILISSTLTIDTFKWYSVNLPVLVVSPSSSFAIGDTVSVSQSVYNTDHTTAHDFSDSIIVISQAGCSSDTIFKIKVHPIPKFQLSSSTPTCSGDTTKILISSTVNSSIDTFKWSVISATSNVIGQDSGKGLQFIPQILTSTNDHDTESVQYKFKVTSQFGCYLTDTSDVIIWQRVNPTPKLASSLISICAQQSINFTPKNTDSSLGGAIFKWKLLKDDFSNKYSILKDSSISTNILGTIFDLATKDSIFNSLPSLDTLTYLYTIINSNTTCKNTQTDAVSGDSLFVDVKPQPNLFYGITPIDVVGANCINTGHRLFKLGRESIDTFEHFVWSWDTWNSTKDSGIYKAETNLNRVMIKTDTTRDVFLASNFTGNYGGCLQKDKFQIKDTTFSTWTKKDPRLILKKYARNGVTDIVLILLANDLSNPKINSSFKYRWGRINKETLVSEVFDDEHGQEYLFQSNKSDDTLTFFYWAEVKMQNDECIRRIYLNDKLLNMKAITQDPAESKEFSVKVYPNPAGNLLNIKLEGLDNLQEVKMELYDLTGQLVKSIDMKSDMLSVPIGHLTKGMYLVTCKQNGVQISSQKLIKE